MSVTELDITMNRGDDALFDAKFDRFNEQTQQWEPVDDHSARYYFTARLFFGGDQVFQLAKLQDEPGLVHFDIPPTATLALPNFPTALVYDVVCIEASGRRSTVVYGSLIIEPSVLDVVPS